MPNSAAFLGFGRRGLREESAEIPKQRAVEVGFGMIDAKTEELDVAGALDLVDRCRMKIVSPPVRLSLRPARRGGRRPIGSAARALRVSTAEQAEKELTLTAQRRSAEEFAARHDAAIDQHDIVPGASGSDTHRTVFNELFDAALQPDGTTAVIVVRHTSRFRRDATHASTPPPWFLRSDNGTRR